MLPPLVGRSWPSTSKRSGDSFLSALAKKPRSWLFSLLALSWAQGLTPTTEAGYILPTRDTLYLLVVFAEVDYSACGEDPHEKQYGRTWPVDSAGTQVPADAPDLIDAVLTPGENPRGIITRTYVEASFGQFVLLGD